jgi:hypothetical protein
MAISSKANLNLHALPLAAAAAAAAFCQFCLQQQIATAVCN